MTVDVSSLKPIAVQGIDIVDNSGSAATAGAKPPTKKRINKSLANAIIQLLRRPEIASQTRIVLNLIDTSKPQMRGGPRDLIAWAKDSVSCWDCQPGVNHTKHLRSRVQHNPIEKYRYLNLPIQDIGDWENDLGLCKSFALEVIGNRTCFDKCK
jgi:hypothetical protein